MSQPGPAHPGSREDGSRTTSTRPAPRPHPVVAVRRAAVRREADREGRRAVDLREVRAIRHGGQLPETPGSDEGCEEEAVAGPAGGAPCPPTYRLAARPASSPFALPGRYPASTGLVITGETTAILYPSLSSSAPLGAERAPAGRGGVCSILAGTANLIGELTADLRPRPPRAALKASEGPSTGSQKVAGEPQATTTPRSGPLRRPRNKEEHLCDAS